MRKPGIPLKFDAAGREKQRAELEAQIVGKPRRERKAILKGLKRIQDSPEICDACWTTPCICQPFPCECGGSITLFKDDVETHSEPVCSAFQLAPIATAERAMKRSLAS